jgi:SsrA-binding protein
MAKEKGRKLIAQNKKARHDYLIIDTYEAGLVLTGTEVKSLRQGRASLADGFVQLDGGEAWLHNVHVPEYSQGTWTNHSARRKRKLAKGKKEYDKRQTLREKQDRRETERAISAVRRKQRA